MRHTFACAITLHRCFDSRPPEGAVEFCTPGGRLSAYEKGGGLYVFTDWDGGPVRIYCRGYQCREVLAVRGQSLDVVLYPGEGYVPPPGWIARWFTGLEHIRAGDLAYVEDGRYRFYSVTPQPDSLKFIVRPGMVGGTLLAKDPQADGKAVSVRPLHIVEKAPPDCYYLLESTESCSAGMELKRIYPGKAIEDGRCLIVCPAAIPEDAGLFKAEEEEGGGWDLQ